MGYLFMAGVLPSLANTERLVYLTHLEASVGMHEKEASALKEIFEEHRVLNLDASRLTHLRDWLNELNQRLTAAIEKQGKYYPSYTIYVLASDQPTAFIYKFMLPGHQVYRGSVFLSIGLVHKYLKNLNETIDTIEKTTLDHVLEGLTGVIAHEFVHPKQDELIKWRWREAQNKSRENHGQMDEASTDFLAIKTLKESRLEPKSMLTGLELLYGNTATQGKFMNRALLGAASSHPEEDVRLGLVRGALTLQRLNEGQHEVTPISYAFDGIKNDLKRTLAAFKAVDDRLLYELNAQSVSNVSGAVKLFQEWLSDPRTPERPDIGEILAHYSLIQVKTVSGDLSDENIEDFKKFFLFLLNEKVRNKFKYKWSGVWDRYNGDNETGMHGIDKVSPEYARKYQKKLDDLSVYKDARFTDWFEHLLQTRFWETFRNGEGWSFEYLPAILPSEYLHRVYSQALLEIEKEDVPDKAMRALLEMDYGAKSAGIDIGLHTQIQDAISRVFRSSALARKVHLAESRNVISSRSDVTDSKWLNGRLLRDQKQTGKDAGSLLKSSYEFYKYLLKMPEYIDIFSDPRSEPFRVLVWVNDSSTFLRPMHRKSYLHAPKTVSLLLETIELNSWQERISDALNRPHEALNSELGSLIRLIQHKDMPFSNKERVNLLLALTKLKGTSINRYNIQLFEKIYFNNAVYYGDSLPFLYEFYKTLLSSTHLSAEALLEELEWDKKIFRKNSDKFVSFLEHLVHRGDISKEYYQKKVLNNVLTDHNENINFRLQNLDSKTKYKILNLLRNQGMNIDQILNLLISQFNLDHFRPHTFPEGYERIKESALRAFEAKLNIVPAYSYILGQLAGGLKSDFMKYVGLSRELDAREFATTFSDKFSKILNLYKKVFNPDQIWIPIHLKGQADFSGVSKLAEAFVPLIPSDGLSKDQYFELWRNIAAKKANRYSDKLFQNHIYPYRKTLNSAQIKDIFENGLLLSEQMKVGLLKQYQESRLVSLSRSVGNISDAEVRDLVLEINRYVSDSSHHKDDYLEHVSWTLELKEQFLNKYIEPMKSFNYQSIDPLTFNVLSFLGVMSQKLSPRDKLNFLEYILDPKGDLLTRVPGVRSNFNKVRSHLESLTGRSYSDVEFFELIGKIETFISEANEKIRVVLNETLIGTRPPYGLIYSNQKILEQLYKLAGLDSEKLTYFKAYSEALPAHERSLLLSYVLAIKGELNPGDSELLKVFERHKTPGIKFAQMASVLSFFGDKESKSLAKAKDSSEPPSRSDIYKRLREVYTNEEFDSIKSVRQHVGSGGIKHVVFVEFKDGLTEAVYLKRDHLENTISSTLGVIEGFVKNLRTNSRYSESYDYDFYLSSLRKQLANEGDFLRELDLSKLMNKMYSEVRAHKGWKFMAVAPSKSRPQKENVLHFVAVKNAKKFSDLSYSDKVIVSELILSTELRFLLERGVFDADRHLGNYLFDPVGKHIFPIDFGQVYTLKKNGIFAPGDHYYLSQIFRGLDDKDASSGAEKLVTAVFSILEGSAPKDHSLVLRLMSKTTAILSSNAAPVEKILKVVAALTSEKVYLPMSYSLGIIKGLSYLTKEDYSKYVSVDFINDRLRSFTKRQTLFGQRFKLFASEQRSCLDALSLERFQYKKR